MKLFRLLLCLVSAGIAAMLSASTEPIPVESAPSAPAPALALEKLSGEDWYREAARIAKLRRESPDVEITAYKSSDDQIAFRFHINRETQAGRSTLALAVPVGEVTTVTLTEGITISPADSESTSPSSLSDAGNLTEQIVAQSLGFVRNHRVLRVGIPITFGAAPGRRLDSGLVHVFFKAPRSAADSPAWAERESTGVLRQALERLVQNPQDLDKFAARSPELIPGTEEQREWAAPVTQGDANQLAFRFPITESKLYVVRGSDLLTSFPGTRLNPRFLHLYVDGQEQPLLFLPASNGGSAAIEPDDTFAFYGSGSKSQFSEKNYFWLIGDSSSPGQRMTTLPQLGPSANELPGTVFPESLVVEKDTQVLTRNDQFLTILGYRWIWQELTTSAPLEFKFDANGLANAVADVPAKIVLYAHSWAPSHHPVVRLRINGFSREFPISAENDEEKSFRLPMNYLKPSDNQVTIDLQDQESTATAAAQPDTRPARLELYFDRLEIKYPRTYAASESSFEFRSPTSDLDGVVTTSERIVNYRISNFDARRKSVLLDVTDTSKPLVIVPEVRMSPIAGAGSVAEFRASESGSHKYLLQALDDAATVSLEVVSGRPDLRATTNCADYIIISHRNFVEAIKPFAADRTADGYAVQTVVVDDIYDQFSAGQHTPEAIKRFLKFAARSWQGSAHNPPATYVLLVGDCTSAYRNQFRNNVINYVPSYSVESSPGSGDRFASDQWYSTIFGEDLLPDLLIGRFSAQNLRDLENIILKNSDYRKKPASGPWQNTLLFIGDHSDFESAVRNVMSNVPPSFFLSRIFMAEEPWVDNYYFPKELADAKKAKVSPMTTRKIRDSINDGAAMITFFGHGSPNVWSNERIWFGGDSKNSDNLMLTNRDKLAFIVNMTCNSGAIDYPKDAWAICISEDFMRIPNGGAIACYVPSGPGITAQHERYTLELDRALFEFASPSIGPVIALADWRYLLAEQPTDLARMFILLGDPSLTLNFPRRIASFLPARIVGTEVALDLPAEFPSTAGYAQFAAYDDDFTSSPIVTYPSAMRTVHVESRLKTQSDAASMAAMSNGGDSGKPNSTGANLLVSPALSFKSLQLEPPGLVLAGQAVGLVGRLQYDGKVPLRQVRLRALDSQLKEQGVSDAVDLLPGDTKHISLAVKANAGITHYTLVSSVPELPEQPLKTDFEIIVTAADPATTPVTPVMFDPDSFAIQFSKQAGNPVAQITMRTANLSEAAVNDFHVALVAADGEILSQTQVLAPAILPGGSSTIKLRREYSGEVPDLEKLAVTLDPYHARPEFKLAPSFPVEIGRRTMPDLVIPPGGVKPSKTNPTDGETVFFDVTIENRGGSRCDYVALDAFDGLTTGAPRLTSPIPAPAMNVTIESGSSTVVHLRWDPFRNAGDHQLRFVATTNAAVPEQDTANNSLIVPLHVFTKYKIVRGQAGVIPPTPEERKAGRIRITAPVQNVGESPVHGVRVVFYRSREDRLKPETALGETLIDEIPAKSSVQATIEYQLKPGEESRPFSPFIDPFIKGSLQRVAVDE